jgi:tRNA-2-methylthio-N6-dimethylallyladenosine synthase
MEGCSKYCSYCVVPYTRGEEINRPLDDVLTEVAGLTAQGVKEITLLGQNVNAYRGSMGDTAEIADFALLIEYIAEIPGVERIRYTTSHPNEFTQRLIDVYAKVPQLVSHLHLPVQHGSDRILMAMKRGYTAMEYKSTIRKLRAVRPDMSMSSDFIVGFPGETEEDYAATRALTDELSFDNAFVFRYSPRKDTPAATMEAQLPEEVKEDRNQDLLSVVNRHAQQKLQNLVGHSVEVLCTGPSRHNDTRLAGRTRGNKITVFEGPADLAGQLVDLDITETAGFTLYGAAGHRPRPATPRAPSPSPPWAATAHISAAYSCPGTRMPPISGSPTKRR